MCNGLCDLEMPPVATPATLPVMLVKPSYDTLVKPSYDTMSWGGDVTEWSDVVPPFVRKDAVDVGYWTMPFDESLSVRQAHAASVHPIVMLNLRHRNFPEMDGIMPLHICCQISSEFRIELNEAKVTYLKVASLGDAFAKASQLFPEAWFICVTSLEPWDFYSKVGMPLIRKYAGDTTLRQGHVAYGARVKPKDWVLWAKETCVIPVGLLEDQREYLSVAWKNLSESWENMGISLENRISLC